VLAIPTVLFPLQRRIGHGCGQLGIAVPADAGWQYDPRLVKDSM